MDLFEKGTENTEDAEPYLMWRRGKRKCCCCRTTSLPDVKERNWRLGFSAQSAMMVIILISGETWCDRKCYSCRITLLPDVKEREELHHYLMWRRGESCIITWCEGEGRVASLADWRREESCVITWCEGEGRAASLPDVKERGELHHYLMWGRGESCIITWCEGEGRAASLPDMRERGELHHYLMWRRGESCIISWCEGEGRAASLPDVKERGELHHYLMWGRGESCIITWCEGEGRAASLADWRRGSDKGVVETGECVVASFWNWKPVHGLRKRRDMVTVRRLKKWDRLHYFKFFGAFQWGSLEVWWEGSYSSPDVSGQMNRWEFWLHQETGAVRW